MGDLDEFDRDLIKRIIENPGISMMEAGRPYLTKISEGGIRYRLRHLHYKGYIILKNVNKNTTECYINPEKCDKANDIKALKTKESIGDEKR